MAKKPQEPKKDPLADEIDELLEKLPGADPLLKGDSDEASAGYPLSADGFSGGILSGKSSANTEPTRRNYILLWTRVGLGLLLGVAVTQWPYVQPCGFPLIGFVAALAVVIGAGVWASIWAWRMRAVVAHVLALVVFGWGAILLANQILLRTGYTRSEAAWRCPEPTPAPAVHEGGGFVARPDGTMLRYLEIGDGPPSLLASGAMVLTDLLRPLADSQGIVLYDPRRRGASRATSDTLGFGIDIEVDDLAAVRQHFATEHFAVLGWSHSAATVAKFAALRSDIVNRVVLISAIPPRRASYQLDLERGAGTDTLGLEMLRLLRIRGEDRTNPDDYCRRYWTTAVLRPWMGDLNALSRSNFDPCRFESEQPDQREANMERLLEGFGNWDWRRDVAGFAGPVLVIHGTSDPFPIEGAAEWIESFPNSRMISIEGAGHMPWLEQPDAVFGAIETFLGGRWPAEAVGVRSDSVAATN